MAFKDLRNLNLISYDDGLIDDGEFFSFQPGQFDFGGSSLRRAAFVFVLKLKVSNDLE